MKRLLLFGLLVFIFQTAKAQRLVPFLANNQQHILNDSFTDLSCPDGEVFHDSLFVAVHDNPTADQSALKVMKNDLISDVPLDWSTNDGFIYDLFSDSNRLCAVGRRLDPITNISRSNLAIFENGIWSNYGDTTYSKFVFGTFFNGKIYLFGNYTEPVCVFENGVISQTTLVGVVDAQVYDGKLFFIKSDNSGIYYLDTLGIVHSESIACNSLRRFSIIDGQLFVSGRCSEFLFRRSASGEWVFDDLGANFSGLTTQKLGAIFRTQHGYVANFASDFRFAGSLDYGSNSYDLVYNIELNNVIRNVLNFEGNELAICVNLVDGNRGGISTVEGGLKYQIISNESVSEKSYASFNSYVYNRALDNPSGTIGLGYKDKKVVFSCSSILFGMKEGAVSGIGGMFSTGFLLPSGLNGAYAGPVANVYSNQFAQKYNRVWKVKQSDIDYHNQHWYEANYSAPIDILEWPGNGSTVNGEPQIIAPFHDVNGNNIYEPQFGDAPQIKGDEATFYIVADGRDVAQSFLMSNFESTVSNLEMSVMTYLFHNSPNQALSQTVFTDYRINLRGDLPLNDFYFGLVANFNIGTDYDDFIGCDSTRNLVFGYNADDFDQPSDWMVQGYENEVPSCGYRFLNTTISAGLNIQENYDPVYGMPTSNLQFYNLLQGKQLDGSAILDSVTQNQTHFEYNGEVGLPGVWNEANVGNLGGDRRFLASTFIGDLQPNTPVCISVARIVGSDTLSVGSPSVNAVYKMKQYSDEVQQYYDQYLQTTDCNQLVGIEEVNEELFGVHVFPNPAREKITIQTSRSSISKIELFNIVGSLVHSETCLKTANTSVDISAYTPGLYSVRIYLEDGTTEVRKIIVE